jgi:hypothetical protein
LITPTIGAVVISLLEILSFSAEFTPNVTLDPVVLRRSRETVEQFLTWEGVIMRAVVVYESMFGSTHQIAEAIAEGLSHSAAVRTVRVLDADASMCEGVDLVVVGGPTQAWSMSRPSTRRGSPLHLSDPNNDLILEPGADWGPGVREWIASLKRVTAMGAAFDTRISAPVILTGRASKSINRQLARHGLTMVTPPESFLVDKKSHLLPGEVDRARAWAARLATQVDHLGSLNA